MKEIINVDVEKIVRDSEARLFQIFLQTDNQELSSWNGNNFVGISDGHNETYLFKRGDVVKQYYAALRDAREETRPSFFNSGRLDVVIIDIPNQ